MTPQKLSDEPCWSRFSELRPDLCIVVAYGKLIPKRYLDLTRLGFINIHPSLLPLYRGPSPIASAILDGRTETGVSIMLLDEDMDHGPVLAQEPWSIPSGFDTPLAEDELSRRGARLLSSVLSGYVDGTVKPVPQDHAAATYCAKFTRADGRLDWSRPAAELVNRIRALGANPGTWTLWNGRSLNIVHAHLFDALVPARPAGSVMLIGTELVVTCGSGAVALEVLQLEGATRQQARDFLNGHPLLTDGILE
jgi:methionyl-tRNA formyltransferase